MSFNAAIVGSGNIGADFLVKAMRSRLVNPVWMVGIDPASEGRARARDMGLRTTAAGVEDFIEQTEKGEVQIAFDATSAHPHASNPRLLQSKGIKIIDLTPAAIGPYCVPVVNLDAQMCGAETNLNMVSCGGQATGPVVSAVNRVQTVEHAEIIATIASRSAGPGTRRNIDEFTRATARSLEIVGGAQKGKAIIILNPVEPPLIMRNTAHCITRDEPDETAIRQSVERMIAQVQQYVPGYRLKNGPVFDGKRVSIFLEVEGLGDYLPKYAGNLDIMTAAALRTGELMVEAIAGRKEMA